MRNVKTCANGSNIARRAWSFGYRIDLDTDSCVINNFSFRIKKQLWRLGTPLLPSMLTIILRRFQTSLKYASDEALKLFVF